MEKGSSARYKIYKLRGEAYRKFNKAKDEDGPKAAKIRIRDVATEKCQKENCANEVGDNVCRF